MKMLGKNVLVRQDPPEARIGSLYVPQGKEEFSNFGTVLGVGLLVTDVKKGDRVLFRRKPGSAISPEARTSDEYYGLLVLPDDHMMAVVS